ncbi:MAG: SDR family oxidoreductase [Clostridia bacterium]|nr:SDR family oxidoreductase [Clostridia bacterium]
MFDLSGKKALVTGSTQGIGFAIAKTLSDHGAAVFVNGASSMEKCARAAEQIPGSVPVQADLTKPDDIDRLCDTVGGVDILVLNASIQYKRDWDKFTAEEFDAQMLCNVKSTYMLIKRFAPYMQKQKWGRIVTIGSVNQYNNHPQLLLYGVTKAAQLKLVRNIAPQLAPFGITVNNVAPGAVDTPRNRDALSDTDFYNKVISSIPCGYIGRPEDIAPAVLLLCSEEGRYITGADLVIDGGMCL